MCCYDYRPHILRSLFHQPQRPRCMVRWHTRRPVLCLWIFAPDTRLDHLSICSRRCICHHEDTAIYANGNARNREQNQCSLSGALSEILLLARRRRAHESLRFEFVLLACNFYDTPPMQPVLCYFCGRRMALDSRSKCCLGACYDICSYSDCYGSVWDVLLPAHDWALMGSSIVGGHHRNAPAKQ